MVFFNKVKQSGLKKEFEKLLDNEKNRVASDKVITNVAILASDEVSADNNLQYHFENCFDMSSSRIYTYRKFDKDNLKSVKHFSEDVIGKNGEILDVGLKSFLNHPFDLLVTFFDKKNLYLEYATLYSKADYKVGFAGVNSNLFDLEIAVDINNIKEYNQEIKKYLSLLKKIKCEN